MFRFLLTAISIALLFSSCDTASGKKEPSGSHQSTAIIQILPSTPPLAAPGYRTDNFIDNEIASLSMGIIASRASDQIKDLDANAIKSSIKVERIANTDMARITGYANDPSRAKQIVEQIIRAYVDVRGITESSYDEKALEALDQALIAQSDLITDLRKDFTVLIRQYGIPYFENSPIPLGQTELEIFSASRKQLSQLETKSALSKAKLRGLAGGQARTG